MPIDYIQKYNKLIKKFSELFDDSQLDSENIHIMQDNIYAKFISDVASNKLTSNKLTSDELSKISKNINKHVSKRKYDKWYS